MIYLHRLPLKGIFELFIFIKEAPRVVVFNAFDCLPRLGVVVIDSYLMYVDNRIESGNAWSRQCEV